MFRIGKSEHIKSRSLGIMEKKKKYMLLGIIGALLLLIGVSYAYWRLTLTQTGVNEVASSCFS